MSHRGQGDKSLQSLNPVFGGLSGFALFNARQKGLASANSVREHEDSFASKVESKSLCVHSSRAHAYFNVI